jgi:hypothetical protein
MKKADRQKYEGFVLAELARGGKLETYTGRQGSAPRYLRTVEDVMIELPSTSIGRELINECKVVRKACEGGWFITPMTPFDATLAGKRRFLYQISMGSTYQNRYSNVGTDDCSDSLKTVIHIVTPFGVFGQCGVSGTHPTVAAARKELKRKLKEHMKTAKSQHKQALAAADEDLTRARKNFEPRITAADSVEVSKDE